MTNNTPDYNDNLYFDCKNCKMTDEYCASGDCNSQNTKNEQQKDLCITSEQLTEQWVNIYKSKKHGSYWSGAFCYKTKEEAVKDLADKENYLTTVNIEDMLNLQTQNAQLKELLKECKEVMNMAGYVFANVDDVKKAKELLQKIDEVLK